MDDNLVKATADHVAASAALAGIELADRSHAAERDALRAEVAALKAAMSRCALGDPPGDCYAAEAVSLRAEVERLRALRP